VTAWIGTSGWSYPHWHPELYPPGLPPAGRLACYTASFRTAELNSSFYRWPSPAAFASWRRRLPAGFRLSVKAPRGLTHARRLYAPEPWLDRIRAGWHELGDKRAVLLVQLPPSVPRDDARLHGPDHDHLYAGSYSAADLAWWAARIREWEAAGKDVFAYFNNDGAANAVRDARALRRLLGG
jgi:uncharacterized protein YecE (DUF72 family)